MPIYNFKCEKCEETAEIHMMTTQFDEAVCDKCGGKMKRLFSPKGINFLNRLWIKPKVKDKMKKMGTW